MIISKRMRSYKPGVARQRIMSALIVTILSVAPIFSLAQNRQDLVGPAIFSDGERVCFVGDSITHGGNYHNYVYLYYLTRFPEREIQVFNAGISGDTATGALKRFDDDIAIHKPTLSTIMLGMNDVKRWLYVPGDATANQAEKKKHLERHYASMGLLTERLNALGSKVAFITPSIYDQTSEMESRNNYGVNDALVMCGEYCKKAAAKQNDGFVDFNAPMLKINAEMQQKDPLVTIVSGDRVHPGGMGHFIMAYTFLKAQQVPQDVSVVSIDAGSGKTLVAKNCAIKEIKSMPALLSFSVLEKALPFPMDKTTEKALGVVPFIDEMNQELLIVKNLEKGKYQLSIDESKIGIFSSAEIEQGINLALHTDTPQYKQALHVRKLNNNRNSISQRLRGFQAVHTSGLYDYKGDRNDLTAVRAYLDSKYELVKNQSYAKYVKTAYDNYFEIMPKVGRLRKELKVFHQKLYMANQPKWHSYSFKALPAKSNVVITATDNQDLSDWIIPDSKEKFHMFLLMGQSNMAGYGDVLPEDKEPIPGVLVFRWEGRDYEWTPARQPIQNLSKHDLFCLGGPFAKAYRKTHPGVTVGLIPVAQGGAPISSLNKGSKRYNMVMNRTRLARRSGVIKGILWHQGESDAKSEEWTDAYSEKLKQLVLDLRHDLNKPEIPFIVGNLGEFFGTGPGHKAPAYVVRINKIRAILRDHTNQLPYIGFVESAGLEAKESYKVHFNRESLIILGQRYAKVYDEVINGKSE